MHTEINYTKRKKRRTRKYLNEIRKRSRRYDSCLGKDHDCNGDDKVQVPNKNNITNKRLTLSMFPKAVRSETITRSVLAKIKHKQDFHAIVKDKKSPPVMNRNMNNNYKIKNDVQHNTSDILPEAKEVIHNEKSIEENESSFGSFILVSPIYRDRENDVSNESEINPFSPIPQVQTSELYNSFIEEHPQLLRKIVPEKYFRYNAMKDLRAELDEIRAKILKSPTQQVTSIKKNNSTEINRIVEDPIEYLRLAQTAPDDITELHDSSPGSPELRPCMHSPLSLIRSTPIIQETPEFKYYPHKLH